MNDDVAVSGTTSTMRAFPGRQELLRELSRVISALPSSSVTAPAMTVPDSGTSRQMLLSEISRVTASRRSKSEANPHAGLIRKRQTLMAELQAETYSRKAALTRTNNNPPHRKWPRFRMRKRATTVAPSTATTATSRSFLDMNWQELLQEAQAKRKESRMTPLHVIFDKRWTGRDNDKEANDLNTFLTNVQRMVAAWPEACGAQDCHGRLPLHLALSSSYSSSCSSSSSLLRQTPGSSVPLQLIQILSCESLHDSDEPETTTNATKTTTTTTLAPYVLAQRKTKNGFLPLHLASLSSTCSLNVIQYLHRLYPHGATVETASGKLPLHLAVTSKRAPSQTLPILQFLHQVHPEAVKMQTRSDGHTALHYAVTNLHAGCGVSQQQQEVLEYLLQLYPEAVTKKTRHQRNLPLHLLYLPTLDFMGRGAGAGAGEDSGAAAEECQVSLESIRLIYNANPAAATTRNGHFKTPLHLALHVGLGALTSSTGQDQVCIPPQRESNLLFLIENCPACVVQSYGPTVPLQYALEIASPVVVRAMIRAVASEWGKDGVGPKCMEFLDAPPSLSSAQEEQESSALDSFPMETTRRDENVREVLRFYPYFIYRTTGGGHTLLSPFPSREHSAAVRAINRIVRQRLPWNPAPVEQDPDEEADMLHWHLRQAPTSPSVSQFKSLYGHEAFQTFVTLLYRQPLWIESDYSNAKEAETLPPTRCGWTPLHRVAFHASFGSDVALCIRELHEQCPSHVQQGDHLGRIPLHVAVERNPQTPPGVYCSVTVVETLISCFPDAMEQRDYQGHTPVDLSLMVLQESTSSRRGGSDGTPNRESCDLDAPYMLLRSMPNAVLSWSWTT